MVCAVPAEVSLRAVRVPQLPRFPRFIHVRDLFRALAEVAMSLTIGIPRELFAGEKRVASVPDVVEKLIKLGFAVRVEADAGAAANFSDEVYQSAGATIAGSAAELWAGSDLVFKVRGPSAAEVGLMREGSTLVSFIWPAQNPELCSNSPRAR
jgi:NAD/NADP transhydrogenase alpha subunit